VPSIRKEVVLYEQGSHIPAFLCCLNGTNIVDIYSVGSDFVRSVSLDELEKMIKILKEEGGEKNDK